MKIAVAMDNNRISQHFGHCGTFMIATIDETSKSIADREIVVPPAHTPGVLPQWLSERGVTAVIAGGMGTQAQELFRSNGVIVITGVQSDHPQRAILSWLNGELPQGTNACDH
jgi:predicted Fe-Mo cluster-binding NifX family protein